MIYRFLDKNTAGGTVKNQMVQNNELAEELNKSINRKFEEWKVHQFLINNIWGADLTD